MTLPYFCLRSNATSYDLFQFLLLLNFQTDTYLREARLLWRRVLSFMQTHYLDRLPIKAEVFLSCSYLKTCGYLLEQSSAAPEQFSIPNSTLKWLRSTRATVFMHFPTVPHTDIVSLASQLIIDRSEIRNRF